METATTTTVGMVEAAESEATDVEEEAPTPVEVSQEGETGAWEAEETEEEVVAAEAAEEVAEVEVAVEAGSSQ